MGKHTSESFKEMENLADWDCGVCANEFQNETKWFLTIQLNKILEYFIGKWQKYIIVPLSHKW